MTNDEQLAAAYPKQIARIRQLAGAEWMAKSPESRSAPNTLASAFDWWTTDEGGEYWNDLYECGPRGDGENAEGGKDR